MATGCMLIIILLSGISTVVPYKQYHLNASRLKAGSSLEPHRRLVREVSLPRDGCCAVDEQPDWKKAVTEAKVDGKLCSFEEMKGETHKDKMGCYYKCLFEAREWVDEDGNFQVDNMEDMTIYLYADPSIDMKEHLAQCREILAEALPRIRKRLQNQKSACNWEAMKVAVTLNLLVNVYCPEILKSSSKACQDWFKSKVIKANQDYFKSAKKPSGQNGTKGVDYNDASRTSKKKDFSLVSYSRLAREVTLPEGGCCAVDEHPDWDKVMKEGKVNGRLCSFDEMNGETQEEKFGCYYKCLFEARGWVDADGNFLVDRMEDMIIYLFADPFIDLKEHLATCREKLAEILPRIKKILKNKKSVCNMEALYVVYYLNQIVNVYCPEMLKSSSKACQDWFKSVRKISEQNGR